MGNCLSRDLKRQFVIFDTLDPSIGTPDTWPFFVTGGYGASPATAGRKLFGEWVPDGDTAGWMPGDAVARLATDDEVRAAIRRRLRATDHLPTWLDPDRWAANEQISIRLGTPA